MEPAGVTRGGGGGGGGFRTLGLLSSFVNVTNSSGLESRLNGELYE